VQTIASVVFKQALFDITANAGVVKELSLPDSPEYERKQNL